MPTVRPDLAHEISHWSTGRMRVAGVDAVGLGPGAGCLVAAAIVWPTELPVLEQVRDSKALRPRLITRLATEIRAVARVAIGAASAAEIDRINPQRAEALAMARALRRLGAIDAVISDGLPVPELAAEWDRYQAVVGGDATVYSVAAASIVAKELRDRLMHTLAARYPGYGWERNVGYLTPAHKLALLELGITPHHRRSYAPVRKAIEAAEAA